MKRENSPFCELSVKHQKGQICDLGIGFDYKPMPWCGKSPREEYTPRTPVLLEGSRDREKVLGP